MAVTKFNLWLAVAVRVLTRQRMQAERGPQRVSEAALRVAGGHPWNWQAPCLLCDPDLVEDKPVTIAERLGTACAV